MLQLESSLSQAIGELKLTQASRSAEPLGSAAMMSPASSRHRELLTLEVENKGLQRTIAELGVELERRKEAAHRAQAQLSEKVEELSSLETNFRSLRDKHRRVTARLSEATQQQ